MNRKFKIIAFISNEKPFLLFHAWHASKASWVTMYSCKLTAKALVV